MFEQTAAQVFLEFFRDEARQSALLLGASGAAASGEPDEASAVGLADVVAGTPRSSRLRTRASNTAVAPGEM